MSSADLQLVCATCEAVWEGQGPWSAHLWDVLQHDQTSEAFFARAVPDTTNGETVPPTWWALPYVKHVSELNARHRHPFNFSTAHKPTKSFRGILVNEKDPLPTMKQWHVVYHIPCTDCPSADGSQTGRKLSTRVKERKGAVKRRDENALLALHCLTTGHTFDWDRASVTGKGTTQYTLNYIEAWNTTSTCVNQFVTLDPLSRALRDYLRWRRQEHPPVSQDFNASAEIHTHNPVPLSPMFRQTWLLPYLPCLH